MDSVTGVLSVFLGDLRGIDPVYAGVIALFFGLLTTRMLGIIMLPAAAAAVYIAAQTILPPVFGHAAIVLPEFDREMLQQLITLYFVFLVADTTVFVIKSAVGSVSR
jgi:hypothetical protein